MIDTKELRSMVNGAQFESFANSVINSLLDRIEAAEKAVAEAYQRGYATGQEEIEAERDALRAKVEVMERQEPVAEMVDDDFGKQIKGINYWWRLQNGAKLYALPGAQPGQNVSDSIIADAAPKPDGE